MKPGDLVRNSRGRFGIVLRVFMHKLWETDKLGQQINWDKVEPQPFAEVLWSGGKPTGHPMKMPQSALEVVYEGR